MADIIQEQEKSHVFALDIGTRSVIGVVGRVEEGKLRVLAIESANHGQRAMLDGQIENIGQVAAVARDVVARLERRTQLRLTRVCVAAAGRALRSEAAAFTLELSENQTITDEIISELEAGAVSEAEKNMTAPGNRGKNADAGNIAGNEVDKKPARTRTPDGRFARSVPATPAPSVPASPVQVENNKKNNNKTEQYYMVGYTVTGYRIDGYPMSSIRDHSGKILEAQVVATFLPRGVVDSLYAVVGKIGLEVASLTLEPIAALNAAIPSDIRLLNLVLVDIGAGTSDIAICRDGSVVGYTMATIAGDEITELLMRSLLVDFETGERLKMSLDQEQPIEYLDILGLSHEMTAEELKNLIAPSVESLAKEIAKRILDLNGRLPSAVFLAGGGSKLIGLREKVAEELKIDPARVTAAGNHFQRCAFSDEYNLNDPEYATPLGIAISAGLGLINDSYVIFLNNEPAKLFRSGALPVRDILMMNGYGYSDMLGRTGANLSFTLNGERKSYRGALAAPPILLINGELASMTDLVRAGDSVQFVPARNGADAQKSLKDILGANFDGLITVNGVEANLDDLIHTGDDIWTDINKKNNNNLNNNNLNNPENDLDNNNLNNNNINNINIYNQSTGPELRVILNGENVVLAGKPGGEPHYLMDLLKYSGLDLENPGKSVELSVNGEPGLFSQRIFNGDEIIIR